MQNVPLQLAGMESLDHGTWRLPWRRVPRSLEKCTEGRICAQACSRVKHGAVRCPHNCLPEQSCEADSSPRYRLELVVDGMTWYSHLTCFSATKSSSSSKCAAFDLLVSSRTTDNIPDLFKESLLHRSCREAAWKSTEALMNARRGRSVHHLRYR
jgi:hypothetical protein